MDRKSRPCERLVRDGEEPPEVVDSDDLQSIERFMALENIDEARDARVLSSSGRWQPQLSTSLVRTAPVESSS